MTPETAVAVPPGDPEALAEAVTALLDDEPRRVALGTAARRLAIERYSWSDIARRLVGDLRVGGRGSPGGRVRLRRPAQPVGARRARRPAVPRGRVHALVARAGLERRLPRLRPRQLGLDRRSRSCSTSRRCWRRSLAWQLTIVQALDPPDPPFNRTFSAFSIGLLGNAVLPGRIGELARVAVLRRRLPHGRGTSAALVGTVFAHRLFDVIPALILIGYVLATAKIPHWATTSLIVVAALGIALLTAATISARRGHRPSIEGAVTARRLVEMARQGLSVLKAPAPAAGAILLQCLGWTLQLVAVYVAMRAFDIARAAPGGRPRAAADERRDDLPALAGQHRPPAGRRRAPARAVRRAVLDRLRVRARAPGGRDVGRRRHRADLPRARGSLLRDASPAAAADRARRPRTDPDSTEAQRARAGMPG